MKEFVKEYGMFFALTAWMVLVAFVANKFKPEPELCESTTVTSLVKSDYRTLIVETANGQHVALYTPTVKPGDSICVYQSQKVNK